MSDLHFKFSARPVQPGSRQQAAERFSKSQPPGRRGESEKMSREKIENTIFSLKMALWHISDSRKAENVAGDIAWYIWTGRASCDYIRAFCGLSKYRINTLAQKILAGGSTDEIITISKKYLKIA